MTTEFERRQYAQPYMLSTLEQIRTCSSRAWKLHVRDRDNFLMYGYILVHLLISLDWSADCGVVWNGVVRRGVRVVL